jgi:O-antigen/teichoic acid export membrane protein
MQLIAWGTLTDLGFGVATSRSLAQTHNTEDRTQFRAIFTTGRTFLLGSNLVFAILIFAASWQLDAFIKLTVEVREQAQLALYFWGGWVLLRATVSLYNDALNATQHMADVNIIQSLSGAGRLILSLAFIIWGWGLVGLVAAHIIADAATLFAQRYRYRQLFPQDHFSWGINNRPLFFEMLKFGITYMIMIVAGKLFSSTDSLILGHLLGAGVVAVYYTTQMPGTVLYQLLWRITDNAAPAINELYAKNNKDTLTRSYLSLLRISLMLSVCLSIGLICLNRYAVPLWVGLDQFAGNLFTAALAGFAITQVMNHLVCIYLVALGDIRLMSLLGIVSGILKVFLSVILVHCTGISGVLIASFSSDFLFLIVFFIKINRHFNIRLSTLSKLSFRPAIKANIIPGLFLSTVTYFFTPNTWFVLILISILYLLAFSTNAWFLGFTLDDRTKVHQLLNNLRFAGANKMT